MSRLNFARLVWSIFWNFDTLDKVVRLPVRRHRCCQDPAVFALEALNGRGYRVVFVSELWATVVWVSVPKHFYFVRCHLFRIENSYFVLRYFFDSHTFVGLSKLDDLLAFLLSLLSLTQGLRPLSHCCDLRLGHRALRCVYNIFFLLFEIQLCDALFWLFDLRLTHEIIYLHWK